MRRKTEILINDRVTINGEPNIYVVYEKYGFKVADNNMTSYHIVAIDNMADRKMTTNPKLATPAQIAEWLV